MKKFLMLACVASFCTAALIGCQQPDRETNTVSEIKELNIEPHAVSENKEANLQGVGFATKIPVFDGTDSFDLYVVCPRPRVECFTKDGYIVPKGTPDSYETDNYLIEDSIYTILAENGLKPADEKMLKLLPENIVALLPADKRYNSGTIVALGTLCYIRDCHGDSIASSPEIYIGFGFDRQPVKQYIDWAGHNGKHFSDELFLAVADKH